MDGVKQWIEAEGTGHWFFITFPVILICLFIWFKGRRIRFLIPSLLISLVIVNPVFYKTWDRMGLYAYWRILWIVPVIPVVAGFVPCITERMKKSWVKAAVVAAGVGLIALNGTFLYAGTGGSFVEAENAAKLPEDVVKIADRLLDLEDKPRIIAQHPIGVYLRQYTGRIDMLFGRDAAGGYINYPSAIASETNSIMNDQDADFRPVTKLLLDGEYDYIVMRLRNEEDLELIDTVGKYGIYKAAIASDVKRERNDLGQTISITALDTDGNADNSEIGYSTVHMAYDSYNNVVKEWRTNAEGNIVLYPGGYASFEQTWRGKNLITRTYLDLDDNPTNRLDGYSKATWQKDQHGTWNVSFEAVNGEQVPIEGLNLAKDIVVGENGWSDWIKPSYDSENVNIVIGNANLGEKKEGDFYTCQIEIEFEDVQVTEGHEFGFWTQGLTDNSWDIGTIWGWGLVGLREPPQDGVYSFTYTGQIDEIMATASVFELGFRCDYWKSGAFRIRNVKIEKGNSKGEWSPGV